MNTLDSVIQRIRPLDREKMAQAAGYVDALAKPLGSLGRLEQLSIQLSGMSGMTDLANLNKEIIVMCADHGVFEEGVAVGVFNARAQILEGLQALKTRQPAPFFPDLRGGSFE